jgi:aspartyl-tRNA(Asn)/glutamyl-tRNA(Gln) amidotransferase subunit C
VGAIIKRVIVVVILGSTAYNNFMKIDIAHIAKLANLPIGASEEKKFEKQLSAILTHIEKLSEVPTDKVEETSQVTGLVNISRSDEVVASLSQNEALANTKEKHKGTFVVPVIIDEAIEE